MYGLYESRPSRVHPAAAALLPEDPTPDRSELWRCRSRSCYPNEAKASGAGGDVFTVGIVDGLSQATVNTYANPAA
jgi:hypothetical protein